MIFEQCVALKRCGGGGRDSEDDEPDTLSDTKEMVGQWIMIEIMPGNFPLRLKRMLMWEWTMTFFINFDTRISKVGKMRSLLTLDSYHNVWKYLKMSHMYFSILAFSTNFVCFNSGLSGNTVWPPALSSFTMFENYSKCRILNIWIMAFLSKFLSYLNWPVW